MSISKTVVHIAAAVALLLGMDAYAHREIRSLRAEIAGAERSVHAEVPIPGPAAARRYPKPTYTEIARAYSIGSAETRNFPGR